MLVNRQLQQTSLKQVFFLLCFFFIESLIYYMHLVILTNTLWEIFFLFQLSCIDKWLKGQGGKCPQCNSKAKRQDIRVLYAKCLKVKLVIIVLLAKCLKVQSNLDVLNLEESKSHVTRTNFEVPAKLPLLQYNFTLNDLDFDEL